jgi:hypothetical protein
VADTSSKLTPSPSQTSFMLPNSSTHRRAVNTSPVVLTQVLLSPLPSISGARFVLTLSATYLWVNNCDNCTLFDFNTCRVKRYLGPIQLHFIKDAWTVRNEGSLESYFYLLLSEVNTVTRSHVVSLGGNALLCHKYVRVICAKY